MKVDYEVKKNVAYVTINRPEVLNAMDIETYSMLSKAWIDVRDNPDVWVAIVTGAGEKSFTVGADLKSYPKDRVKMPKAEYWQTQKDLLLNRGLEVWKPIIAAVNGFCMGGGMTLLFSTDFRVAADHSVFELSEVKIGALPGNGGTQRALRELPFTIAMEMLLLGRRLNAKEALKFNLVNKIVPLSDLMSTAEAYALKLCEVGPLATRAIKELAIKSQYLPIEYGLRFEQMMAILLRTTEDYREGTKAFTEKRKPQYRGE